MRGKIIFPSRIIVGFYNYSYQRYNPSLLNILAEALKFKYTLTSPSDNEYGRQLADGNWTGLIGQVHRDEADLALSDLSITEERKSAVDFSEYYFLNEVIFTTNLPKMFPKSFDFIQPFQREVWLLVAISVFLSTIVLPGRYFRRMTYVNSFFSLMFRQPISKEISYSKVMLAFWLLFITVLFNCYSSCLTSSVTVPIPEVIPRNFEELSQVVSAGKFRCLGWNGSSSLKKLIDDGNNYTKHLGEVVFKNKWFLPIFSEINSSLSENIAVFMNLDFAYFRFGMPLFNTKYISKDSVIKYPLALAVQKSFCCLEQLNLVILRLKRAGLIDKIYRDSIFRNFIEKNCIN